MTVSKTNLSGISNISWFNGNYPTNVIANNQKPKYFVLGNPNKPKVLNSNPDAGVVRTFDSRGCFGYELT